MVAEVAGRAGTSGPGPTQAGLGGPVALTVRPKVNERRNVPSIDRAPAFSRYELYVRIVVDDPAAPDRRRSSVHHCAAAWIESDES